MTVARMGGARAAGLRGTEPHTKITKEPHPRPRPATRRAAPSNNGPVVGGGPRPRRPTGVYSSSNKASCARRPAFEGRRRNRPPPASSKSRPPERPKTTKRFAVLLRAGRKSQTRISPRYRTSRRGAWDHDKPIERPAACWWPKASSVLSRRARGFLPHRR